MIPEKIKIIVVGDTNVGKTTFVKRLISGNFEEKYGSTVDVDVRGIKFNTTEGETTLELWDCSGRPELGAFRSGYYREAKGAILMFDVQNPYSYRNIKDWYLRVRKVCPDIPIVLCGNKVDLPNRVVKPNMFKIHKGNNIKYYDISVKSGGNMERPILYLFRKITEKPSLCLLR